MKFSILQLLLLYVTCSSAQNWDWVKSYGGIENETILALKADPDGGFVGVGEYNGTAQFGNETLEAINGSDAFLMKANDLGEVQWVVSGGGSSNDSSHDVEVDSEGNLIWLGVYWVTAFFENDTIYTGIGTGSRSFFVAKYNPEGQLLWVKSIDGNYLKQVNDLVVDEADDIYLTGYFRDSLFAGNVVLKSIADDDAFVLKMNSNGEALWGKQYGESGTTRPQTISFDSEGDLIVGGNINGTATFGDDVLTSVNTDYDIFVAKLDSEGEPAWGTIGTGVFDNSLNTIAIDEQNNIFVSGTFEGVMDIGNESIQTPGNKDNLYLLKLNNEGDPIWARGLDDQEFNERSTSFSIALRDSQVFMTGHFLYELIIDDLEITGGDQLQAYLASFDVMTGLVEQLYLIQGSSTTIGVRLLVDSEERLTLAGIYLDDLYIGGEVYSSQGGTDFFIARTEGDFTQVSELSFAELMIELYPNPVLERLYIHSVEPLYGIEIFDTSGRLMLSTQQSQSINVSLLPAGYYIIKLKAGQTSYAFSFIKM